MLPRVVVRESRTVPSSVVSVVLTDGGERWVVDGRSGSVVVDATSRPQATISGGAADVLLRLWGRPVPDGSVSVDGDATVADAWLSLGGA